MRSRRAVQAAQLLAELRQAGRDVEADSSGELYVSGPTPPIILAWQDNVDMFAAEIADILARERHDGHRDA